MVFDELKKPVITPSITELVAAAKGDDKDITTHERIMPDIVCNCWLELKNYENR